MSTLPDSQLSAIASAIDDLAVRVSRLAEELQGTEDSDRAAALFEVERSLHMANRSIDRARRAR